MVKKNVGSSASILLDKSRAISNRGVVVKEQIRQLCALASVPPPPKAIAIRVVYFGFDYYSKTCVTHISRGDHHSHLLFFFVGPIVIKVHV
jgi:hypothetical protein